MTSINQALALDGLHFDLLRFDEAEALDGLPLAQLTVEATGYVTWAGQAVVAGR
ncbi:hypothetical protein [Kribbella sp. NPDC049227]|uniref:hypothetical protein n=1 Tax=Kribbella sp. NPDC049227 TaxID=3364113 RepID=UPI00371F73A5